MIARETSNSFKKLLITDKCQQKLAVLQTVHTGRSPPNYSLQTTARTHGSSPAEIDSELVSHRRLDNQWWLVTGTRFYLDFKTFATFWHSLRRTYSLSSLYCTKTLMSSDFNLIEQLLHRNKQLQAPSRRHESHISTSSTNYEFSRHAAPFCNDFSMLRRVRNCRRYYYYYYRH